MSALILSSVQSILRFIAPNQVIPSSLTKEIQEFDRLIRTVTFHPSDLPAYIDAAKSLSSQGIDDRLLLLEKLLVLMSHLPESSPFSKGLERFVISILYNDLPHPPSGYLSYPDSSRSQITKNISYAFRSLDGSNYNTLFPSLGRAGTPYARSVPSMSLTPSSTFPDSGLVFDTLLRRDKFEPHPAGISSLFFAFANLVIHSIFDTNHQDCTLNNASSYLDLSPLYGSSPETANQLRRRDGTGKLWEDVFADGRLLLMPPSVCALLVLLCRNHNQIAEKILDINERDTFSNPPPTDEDARTAQDNELFDRARLVNCGFFMQLILRDYVGTILALVHDGLHWRLNPLETMRAMEHEFRPCGQGNVASIEFNLLYRWHATISSKDAEWLEGQFRKRFGDIDFRTITVEKFRNIAHKGILKTDVREWTFDGLKRTASGRFNDQDLARILHNATESPAGSFRARGTPEVLRVVEILTIEQARRWGTCSLNEFRKYMGLKPYKNFKEWNSLPEIHTAAETLYGDIDNLELHVGLQAEEAKKPAPGAGLCPGYTISRAILADAVCLTRGDRFLTTDFTPFNLTSWGYQHCFSDSADGSCGGMLTKLLFRTLPSCYPAGSAYSHFPFMVPEYLKSRFMRLPEIVVDKYLWSRPPVMRGYVNVGTYASVLQVISDEEKYPSEYNNRISVLTKGSHLDHTSVNDVIFSEDDAPKWRMYFLRTTEELIHQKSVRRFGSTTSYIDIVGDVINLLPIYWIANEIIGLPLEFFSGRNGRSREHELFDRFADVCNYTLLNLDPSHDWTLRESATRTTDEIVAFIKAKLEQHADIAPRPASNLFQSIFRSDGASWHRSNVYTRLMSAAPHCSLHDLACSLFSVVVPNAALYSQTIANVVNYYFSDNKRMARDELTQLTKQGTQDAEAKVLAYIREAIRLDPPVVGVQRTAAFDSMLGSASVPAGSRVFANILEANLDVAVFGPDPLAAVYDRASDNVPIWNFGGQGLLSSRFFEQTAPQILRAVLHLKDVQRVAKRTGELKWILDDLSGTKQKLYVDTRTKTSPWAKSLTLQFESGNSA